MIMSHELTKISKRISFVLRHHPEKIGLHLDKYGRANVSELIYKYNHHYKPVLNLKLIHKIINNSNKQRYLIEGEMIRALYGHSIPVKLLTPSKKPPYYLYHGTTHKAARLIILDGLKKMNRDFVHLSQNKKEALLVGKRRDTRPIIFQVLANKAFREGLIFYPTKSGIWLIDHVPPKYLKKYNNRFNKNVI